MSANLESNSQSRANGTALAVVVRSAEDGARLTREAVSHADFSDVFSEAWRDACLRKGQPRVPLADVSVRVVPKLKTGSGRLCAAYDLALSVPGQPQASRSFTARSLGHVSQRMAQRLVETGVLAAGQTYTYEVVLDSNNQANPPDDSSPLFQATVKTPPLSYLVVPLRELLAQASAVDMLEEEVFPVFYTTNALALAERFARKGADAVPPVETGGVLIGSLCSCPQSGEFFAVVTDVLEVQDAEQKEFALAYTSKTWMRIQTILRARQTAHPERAERILGQCHGHNSLPNDGKICEACLHRPECSLTNLFVSLDDQQWSRAVFIRQPWQLCHIFGLAARGDRVNSLFTLLDGRLQPRGYFKLPGFHPEHWTQKPATKELSHA